MEIAHSSSSAAAAAAAAVGDVNPRWCDLWVAVLLLLLSCRVGSGSCQNVDISIPLFNTSALKCSGSFQFSNDDSSVDLTPVTGNGASNQFQSARAMYARPVQLYDRAANASASFSTSFVMGVYKIRGGGGGAGAPPSLGEGMAFLIAPRPEVSPAAHGGALGLFDVDSTGASTSDSRVVAVEFDTLANAWDWPGAEQHVGIDINSLVSVKRSVFSDSLTGHRIGVWIDYLAAQRRLEIRMTLVSNTSRLQRSSAHLLLSYSDFDLSSFVDEYSYVGFSAGTGSNAELNQVFSWHFATSGLPDPDRKQARGGDALPAAARASIPLVAGLAALSAAAVVVSGLLCRRRWRRNKDTAILPSAVGGRRKCLADASSCWSVGDLAYGPRRFGYKELSHATKGFSQVLGEGGFGTVYKGLLADGSQVAVKQVAEDSKQGEREFRSEVNTIGRLRHRNLVQMKGWCREQGNLLLVYDYMPNGSLDRYLFNSTTTPDDCSHTPLLSWPQRFNIIKGVAAALLYLHEEWDQPVVHRDVKASNVMLDSQLNARLSDFGLARLMADNKLSETVTITAGTVGYLAPECTYTGKVSAESDVFSFGAVVLEVVSGRRPVDMKRPVEERSLVMWMWSCYTKGRLLDAVDTRMQGHYNVAQLTRVLHVGLLCALPQPQHRPTIRLALQYLMGVDILPPLPLSLFARSTSLERIDIASLMSMTTNEFSTVTSFTISPTLPLLGGCRLQAEIN